MSDSRKNKVVELLLEEIATDANYLSHALLNMEHNEAKLDGEALAIYRNFSDKIGWMADQCLKDLTGHQAIKGDAESWFLNPTTRDALIQAQDSKKQ